MSSSAARQRCAERTDAINKSPSEIFTRRRSNSAAGFPSSAAGRACPSIECPLLAETRRPTFWSTSGPFSRPRYARSRAWDGLLGVLPDQFDASTRRAGGSAVLQLIAGNREGPFLGGAIPVGIGAGLDVESESLVLLVHGVLAKMRDAARDDGLILVRGSL